MMIKQYIKKTKIGKSLQNYLRIPLRLRFINWFIQRFIYRTPNLHFSLHFASRITHADKLIISESAKFSLAHKVGCYLECSNGVEIGEGTIIAPGVKIISANHDFDNYNNHRKEEPVRIGENCWLGANCIILPGVKIGNRVIIGAGSVVTKSFPDNCIIAGVPAKIIRMLDDTEHKSNHNNSE